MKIMLVASVLVAAASPAFAGDVQKPAKVKEVKVCQRVGPTGSIMAVKSCRTQKEWDELSAKGQDTVRQVRDRSAATLGAGSGN